MVNILENTHHTQLIAVQTRGEIWNVFCVFKIWFAVHLAYCNDVVVVVLVLVLVVVVVIVVAVVVVVNFISNSQIQL